MMLCRGQYFGFHGMIRRSRGVSCGWSSLWHHNILAYTGIEVVHVSVALVLAGVVTMWMRMHGNSVTVCFSKRLVSFVLILSPHRKCLVLV